MKTMTVIFNGTITAPMGYASSKSSKKDRDKNTSYQALPTMAGQFILPGEQLAGALRRAGMDDIRDAFPEDPMTSILSFYQARVGGIAGFGKNYKAGEMTALRRKNPFVSLWGKAGLSGHIGMGHAVGPVTETVVVAHGKNGSYDRKVSTADRVHGFRSDDLARNPETDVPVDFWSQREVLKFAGKSPENSKQVAAHVSNADFWGFPVPADGIEDESLAAADTADEGDAPESGKGKLTNIQNGYGGFEYLPNETSFAHRFTVTGTEAEILMLMASFNGFARNPRLGGHWRHNLGWVDMHYTVYLREEDLRLAPREVGCLKINSHLDSLDAPAIETEGMVSEWMNAYLALRRSGFPDMDINSGVEDEMAVIHGNLKKIGGDARKAAEKAAKKTTKKTGDVQAATEEEVNDVAD
jgi:hypothetical protein